MNANRPATICVHGGAKPHAETGALNTPIYQTSTYVQDSPGQPRLYDYARAGNPTRTAAEQALALLEGGTCACSFASGLAASQAVMQLLAKDSHVLVCEDVYGGSGRLFTHIMAKFGVEFDFIDMRVPQSVAAAIKDNTRLIWLESPTNPLLHLVDIQAIVQLAAPRHIITVVDNTFASPVFQSPLALGADLVLHSTTKYIGGHSDLIGGAVITKRDDLAEQLRFMQLAVGAIPAPFESFLLARSIRTLHLRMQRHQANALRIAQALEQSQRFAAVIYPGLPSHPQHVLAKQQMRGFGGIISVRLHGGKQAVDDFLKKLRLFRLAESLGGVESLINHPETMTHASVPPARRQKLGIDGGLLRLSVGIENCDDLLADLSV